MQMLHKKRARLLTFSFESCEDKDEIVVEVRKLVELFKFLARQLRTISLIAALNNLTIVRWSKKIMTINHQ